MTPDELDELRDWFERFVHAFYNGNAGHDRYIRLKEDHTLRVCDNIVRIGQALNFAPDQINLASASALLHDVGRFRQYDVYHTFNDRISVNHAKQGLLEIAREKPLGHLSLRERRLVCRAVAYHNAAEVPAKADSETLLLAGMLRDADKLDIWKVLCDYYRDCAKDHRMKPDSTLMLNLPDDPVFSENILKAFRRKRFAAVADVKTIIDFKLLQLSWVFDLNCLPSFHLLKKRGYIDQIAATLPSVDAIKNAVEAARRYVDSMRENPTV